jgi:hypothetical protein
MVNISQRKRILYSANPQFTPGYRAGDQDAPPNFTDWAAVIIFWLCVVAFGVAANGVMEAIASFPSHG